MEKIQQLPFNHGKEFPEAAGITEESAKEAWEKIINTYNEREEDQLNSHRIEKMENLILSDAIVLRVSVIRLFSYIAEEAEYQSFEDEFLGDMKDDIKKLIETSEDGGQQE